LSVERFQVVAEANWSLVKTLIVCVALFKPVDESSTAIGNEAARILSE
jgi:hypothetical protein